MATQRNTKNLPPAFPENKPNRKIQLKNDILKWLERNELGWSTDACEQQGNKFINTLTETLWNLDGHAETLKSRGCGIPGVCLKDLLGTTCLTSPSTGNGHTQI